MRILISAFLTSINLLNFACSNNLPEYGLLGDLRILAMKADTPEISDAGATVTITPWISDLNGKGRTLTYSYQTCLDPGISFGAKPTCSGSNFNSPTSFGPVGSTRKTYTGAAPNLSIAVPAGLLAASSISTGNKFNGIAYLVIYRLQASDQSVSTTAFKRIIISTNSTKNNNPSISGIQSNSSALTLLPGTATHLTGATANLGVTVTPSSAESYQTAGSDGGFSSLTEGLSATWFYSDGSNEYARTVVGSTNLWTLPSSAPTDRSTVLVTVVRDGRGGEDVQQVEFQ